MAFPKLDDKPSWRSTIRAIKTLFFLVTMTLSFLFFSAPVLLAIADSVLPSALLSASLPPIPAPNHTDLFSSLFSDRSSLSLLRDYDFRSSLVDIPLLSIARSFLILCIYSWCDGPRLSRGPYLWVATACTVVSVMFVSVKASFVFGRGGGTAADVALFCSSYALAVGHVVVAYRTSCRERKKLLVYKIDIEAVSACKNGFLSYPKTLQQDRIKK